MTDPWFPDPATSRAVLIGASRFAATDLPNIPAVRGNLTALRAALTHPTNGTLTAAHCTVVADPTSPAAVGAALATASTEATDLLLVYYAGHGILDDDGLLHFALGDTLPHRAGYTAIPLELLKRDLGRARARARVLVLDCCFSGQAVEAMGAATGVAAGQLHVAGTYTLTSTTATTPSHAPKGAEHTAFTGALLKAMTCPHPLTLDDIYTHVDNEMAGLGLPRPQRRATNTADRIGLVRGPVQRKTEPPSKPELIYELEPAETSGDGFGTSILVFLFVNAVSIFPLHYVMGWGAAVVTGVTLGVIGAVFGLLNWVRKIVVTSASLTGIRGFGKDTVAWIRIEKIELKTVHLKSGAIGTVVSAVFSTRRNSPKPPRFRWHEMGIATPPDTVARAMREYVPDGVEILVDQKPPR